MTVVDDIVVLVVVENAVVEIVGEIVTCGAREV